MSSPADIADTAHVTFPPDLDPAELVETVERNLGGDRDVAGGSIPSTGVDPAITGEPPEEQGPSQKSPQ